MKPATEEGSKVLGVVIATMGAWGLQDWSHAAAIGSSLVAIVVGVIYSIKMVLEGYWTVKIKKLEFERMETKEQES